MVLAVGHFYIHNIVHVYTDTIDTTTDTTDTDERPVRSTGGP